MHTPAAAHQIAEATYGAGIPVMPILSTMAVGIIIEQLIKLFYPQGSNPQVFPQLIGSAGISLGTVQLSGGEIVIVAATAFIFLLTQASGPIGKGAVLLVAEKLVPFQAALGQLYVQAFPQQLGEHAL